MKFVWFACMDIIYYAYIHAQKDKISKYYIYLYIRMYYKSKNEPLCILDIGYIFASINNCKDNI